MAHQDHPMTVADPAEGLILPDLNGAVMASWQKARRQILEAWGFDIALNEDPMPYFRSEDKKPLSSHCSQILLRMAKAQPGRGRSVIAHLLQYCRERRRKSWVLPVTPTGQQLDWIKLKDLEQFSALVIGFQRFEVGNFGAPVPDTALAIAAARALTELTGSTLTPSRPSIEERDTAGHVNSPHHGLPGFNAGFDPVTGWHRDPRVAVRIEVSTAPEEVPEVLLCLLSTFTLAVAENRGMDAQRASQAASNVRHSASEVLSSVQAVVEQALQTASSNNGQLAHHGSNETTEDATPTNQPLSETHLYMGAMPSDAPDEDDQPPVEARRKPRTAGAPLLPGETKERRILYNWGLDTNSNHYPMYLFRPNDEPVTKMVVDELVTLSNRFPGRGQAVVAALLEFAAERHSSGLRRRTTEHVTGRDIQEFNQRYDEDEQYALGNFAPAEPGYGYQPPPGYYQAGSTSSGYQPVDLALRESPPTSPTVAKSAEEEDSHIYTSGGNPTREKRKRRRVEQPTDTDMMDDTSEQEMLKRE